MRFVGQAHFDNQECPCPKITHSVKFGEEFQLVEGLGKSLEELQMENGWAFAQKIGEDGCVVDEKPKKVPLKFLAVLGSLDTYSWFYGKFDRVKAINELDQAEYAQGTFMIRQSVEEKEVFYVLSVVTKQRTHEEAAEIKHYKIKTLEKQKKGCLAKTENVVKFDGASKRFINFTTLLT